MAVKEEWVEVAEALPDLPPENVIEDVKKRLKEGVMLYRAGYIVDPMTELKEKCVRAVCTACGEKHCFDYSSYGGGCHSGYGASAAPFGFIEPTFNEPKTSQDDLLCPTCGAAVKALHIGAFKREYLIDNYGFLTPAKAQGHYVFVGWRLDKYCDKEGRVWFVIRKVDAMTVIGKTAVRFSGYQKNGYGSYGAVSWKDEWFARPNYFSDYETWRYAYTYGLNEMDTLDTEIEKSGAIEFFKQVNERVPIAAYLKLWTKYPSVENLVKGGCAQLVAEMIDKCMYQAGWYVVTNCFEVKNAVKYADFKKVKPHEILGVEKKDLSKVNGFSLDEFLLYRFVWQTERKKLSKEEFKVAYFCGVTEIKEIVETFQEPTTRILRYLQKQKKVSPRPEIIRTNFLKDYWDMTRMVYGEIVKELLYPKDLRKAHDTIQNVYNAKKNELYDREIKAYAKELEKFAFTDEETGLFIRACSSQTELIKEGKALSHCVAKYAEAVAKRKTSIFFIRKISAPKKPYYTLEYKNGEVNQNEGKKHCPRTNEVVLFENKWLEFIKSIKEKANGKQRIAK